MKKLLKKFDIFYCEHGVEIGILCLAITAIILLLFNGIVSILIGLGSLVLTVAFFFLGDGSSDRLSNPEVYEKPVKILHKVQKTLKK